MESLYAELVSNGILVPVAPVHIQDYLGAYSYMGATLEKAGIIPDPSMAQVGTCWLVGLVGGLLAVSLDIDMGSCCACACACYLLQTRCSWSQCWMGMLECTCGLPCAPVG
jgi:hypothetical protein